MIRRWLRRLLYFDAVKDCKFWTRLRLCHTHGQDKLRVIEKEIVYGPVRLREITAGKHDGWRKA